MQKRIAMEAGWNVEYHRFGGWRAIRNDAKTDDDVTVYCETENEAWVEAFDITCAESAN